MYDKPRKKLSHKHVVLKNYASLCFDNLTAEESMYQFEIKIHRLFAGARPTLLLHGCRQFIVQFSICLTVAGSTEKTPLFDPAMGANYVRSRTKKD